MTRKAYIGISNDGTSNKETVIPFSAETFSKFFYGNTIHQRAGEQEPAPYYGGWEFKNAPNEENTIYLYRADTLDSQTLNLRACHDIHNLTILEFYICCNIGDPDMHCAFQFGNFLANANDDFDCPQCCTNGSGRPNHNTKLISKGDTCIIKTGMDGYIQRVGDVIEWKGLDETVPKPTQDYMVYIKIKADPIIIQNCVARQVKDAFIGINTKIPITRPSVNNITFTSNNMGQIFDIHNKADGATHEWTYDDIFEMVYFKPQNVGVNNSTATIKLKLKKKLTNFQIYECAVHSESNYDKLYVSENGRYIANGISGNISKNNVSLSGNIGDEIVLKYTKDGSNHDSYEHQTQVVFKADPIKETIQEIVGYENKDVARKIKKAFIGIGGVARPCFGEEPLEYYGTITPLSGKFEGSTASFIQNYALFAGGTDYPICTTNVDVYNRSLTKTSATGLSTARYGMGATQVSDKYVLFGGGRNSDTFYNTVDAYNGSLTRTTAPNLAKNLYRYNATKAGNFALFAGGENNGNTYYLQVEAYNSSLTKQSATALSVNKRDITTGHVSTYGLFAGGFTGNQYVDTVEAYSSSLTKVSASPLSEEKVSMANAIIGNKTIFAGGAKWRSNPGRTTNVDTYNSSLVRSSAPPLTVARNAFSGTDAGEGYVLFAGGYDGNKNLNCVDAYDSALVKNNVSPLNEAKATIRCATKVGNYALFGGCSNSLNDVVDAYVYNNRRHQGGTN